MVVYLYLIKASQIITVCLDKRGKFYNPIHIINAKLNPKFRQNTYLTSLLSSNKTFPILSTKNLCWFHLSTWKKSIKHKKNTKTKFNKANPMRIHSLNHNRWSLSKIKVSRKKIWKSRRKNKRVNKVNKVSTKSTISMGSMKSMGSMEMT